MDEIRCVFCQTDENLLLIENYSKKYACLKCNDLKKLLETLGQKLIEIK